MNWLKLKLRAWLEVPDLPEPQVSPPNPDNHHLRQAMADCQNASIAIIDLGEKFDALAEALGVYVVAGEGAATVVAIPENMALAQAKHTLDAKIELLELRRMLASAKGSVDRIAELERKCRRASA